VFGEFDPPWLAKAIATIFILAGAALAISAQRRACINHERLLAHEVKSASAPNYRLLGYSVALGALLLVVGLWFLNDGELSGAAPDARSQSVGTG